MDATTATRRDDLDGLRVFATYLLFVFHVAMVFNPAPFYHIRNRDLSMVMLVVSGFISLWHMPLFFLLAGWSIAASLRVRGTAGFARERLLRLAVPLVAGCALLMPPIKYLELRSGLDLSHRGLRVSAELQDGFRSVIPSGLQTATPFHEGFFEFLPTFYTQLDRFTWAHLWFVAYLFSFTLLYLPLFSRLLRSPRELVRVRPVWVYLPVVPLAFVQVVLRPRWPGIQNLYDDWANVAYYSTFLWAGFLLARFPVLERALHREWRRALAIGIAATVLLLGAVLGLITSPSLTLAGTAVAGWCLVVALLGIAHERPARRGPALTYLTESAFPVYVLHQVAIVVIGYWLVQLRLGIAPKFVLLLAASVMATLGVYQVVICPSAPLRVLFGMRPKACPLRARAAPPRAAVAAALAVALLVGVPRGASGATPIGLWHAEGGAAQVAIETCGDELCGHVVSLRSPFDEQGCALRDRYNPDPRLRYREVIGLEIVRGLQPAPGEEATWTGGIIYDPTSGRSYRCVLQLEGDDRLLLRGYVGIRLLGRTTRWIRAGSESRTCQQLSGPSGSQGAL